MGHEGSKLDANGDELEEALALSKGVAPRTSSARSIGKVRKARSIKITALPALARRSLQLSKWKGRRLLGQLCGVIRHAERADGIYAFIGGQRWTQTDDFQRYPLDPPLSDAGVEAAKEMGQQVADFAASECVPIHIVISSPYFRCVQTAVEVCCKLGPHIRLIIDHSLGEVYGSCVMGAFEPLHTVRPLETTLRYCAFKDVTVVQKAVGKWPTWSEDLKAARRRYAKGYLSYLHRSAVAKRNFLIVTHADCVGAALSMMPSQAGFAIESVEYGGMMLATRGLGETCQADRNGGIMHETVAEADEDLDFEELLPCGQGANADKSVPRRPSDSNLLSKRMNAWEEEDASNGSDMQPMLDAFGRSARTAWAPPKEADGWKVRVHNINARAIAKEKARTSTKAMKSVKSLIRNTSYTQEQIETLLGMMSDSPLEDGRELQSRTSPHSNKMLDSRVLSKTDCSLATYIFGMSDCGSNMDDCRSQCSESEYAYMATYGVPVAASREATLDLIDERQITGDLSSPREDRPARWSSGSCSSEQIFQKAISESRRIPAGGRPSPSGEMLDERPGNSLQAAGAPRSITLEELRNLNESQKRELISASVAERRERLGAGMKGCSAKHVLMGRRSRDCSPSGANELSAIERDFGQRFVGKRSKPRVLTPIRSATATEFSRQALDEGQEDEESVGSTNSGASVMTLTRNGHCALPCPGREPEREEPEAGDLPGRKDEDVNTRLSESTTAEDGNTSSDSCRSAGSSLLPTARAAIERARPAAIQVHAASTLVPNAQDMTSTVDSVPHAGNGRPKRELSRPTPIQIASNSAPKAPVLECVPFDHGKDVQRPGSLELRQAGVVISAESPTAAGRAGQAVADGGPAAAPSFAGSALMQRRAQKAASTAGATATQKAVSPGAARPNLTIVKASPGFTLEPLDARGV